MKIVKIITSIGLLAVLATSCDKLKDFGDTNVSPNATTVPNTAALLTNVLANVSNRASQQNPGYYCQYFAETQYPGVSLYSLPQFDMDGIYAGAMYDCQNIINTNSDVTTAALAAANGSNANQIAIATILRSYYYWTITDAWGDIPYTEALTISNTVPKFDKQEDVYKGVIADLTGAVDKLDVNGATVKGDIAYSGNVDKWKKLGNSIKALMALRLSKKYPGASEYAATQFKAALAQSAGTIDVTTDNFAINFPGGNFLNTWNANYNSRDDIGESLQMVTTLSNMGDQRQSAYGRGVNGVPYGRDRATFMNVWFAANSTTYAKVLSDANRQPNSKVSIIHAAAVLLAKAEATELGWISGTPAATYYANAITESYAQWNLPAATVAPYLANPLVVYTGTTAEKINKIALQRYIALYPDGLQGWCEWRRTGIPALTPAINSVNTGGQIPRRFVYGGNDYNTNPTQVAAAAAAIPLPVPTPTGATAGDTQNGRVWWDQ
jgi:Starch-binding associating with outer membrane